MILGVFLRPKDNGAGIKTLHLQFFFFVCSEGAHAVYFFRTEKYSKSWYAVTRIPFYLIAYWLGLKLRRRAAHLPPAELSNFLCQTVLLGGVSAMSPMVFFMFEAVSCMTTGNGLGDKRCENTTYAAMYLSVYLVIITIVSIANRTVPQEERGKGMTYIELAILRLNKKEKVQGSLGVVTALVSMYLFSVLGIEGDCLWYRGRPKWDN